MKKVNSKNLLVGSDWHILHKKIVEQRGFNSQEEHDNFILKGLSDNLTVSTPAICCGDVFLGNDDEFFKKIDQFMSKKFPHHYINGKPARHSLSLAMGNHDNLESIKRTQLFTKIGGCIERNVQHFNARTNKIEIYRTIFTHIPIHPSELKPHGRWDINVHGHLHGDVIDHPQYINVCFEQTGKALTPLSEVLKSNGY